MIFHYIAVVWRHIRRHKKTAALNIVSLTIGIACAILILGYVHYEYTVNQAFSGVGRLFRVTGVWKGQTVKITPPTIGPALQTDMPGVSRVNRSWGGRVIVNADEDNYRDNIWLTDETFFQMFDFPFLYGIPAQALNAPHKAVITERLAQKYFGASDVIGRTLQFEIWTGAGRRAYTITGVLRNPPYNSVTHFGPFQADIFISLANVADFFDPSALDDWNSRSFITYIECVEGAQDAIRQYDLPALMDRHAPSGIRQDMDIKLDALTDLYLTDNDDAALKGIYIMLALMGFILALACINFMNLATVRSELRTREIGLRKVLGGERRTLALQFLGESILLSVIAAVLGVLLAAMLFPVFSTLVERPLTAAFLMEGYAFSALVALTLVTGMMAGSYPALLLSSFNPVQALRGGVRSGRGPLYLRRVLVVAQYTAAIFFAVTAYAASRQMTHITAYDPGFYKENMLVIRSVPREWHIAGVRKQEAVKRALKASPNVMDVTLSWDLPGEWTTGQNLAAPEWVEGRTIDTALFTVDEAYADVYDLQLSEGRFFSKAFFAADSARSVILNQAAVMALGWSVATDRSIVLNGQAFTVVGVVRDFNYAPLDQAVQPQVFRYVYGRPLYRYLTVRTRTAVSADVLDELRAIWADVYPDAPFEYTYLSDDLRAQYGEVERRMNIAGYASALAVCLACLGLIGLVSFSAARRTREVGIRKVLGASMPDILRLLSGEFLALVLPANLIACILAYAYLSYWLQDWAYRIDMAAGLFILPAITAFAVVFLIVILHGMKTARANPIDSLRYE